MTQEIKDAAESLAAAKMEAESGMAVLTVASAEINKVRARVSELETARAQIVASRKAGKTSPKDGGHLSEIEADLEGLREILVEKAQAYTVAGAEFQRLQQAVAAAEYALGRASDDALLAELKQVAGDLDRRLVDTLHEIASVAKRMGRNLAPWYPTSGLADGIRRLDLENGALRR